MLEKVYKKREDIFEIIRKAGDEILKVYSGNDFQVEIKSDKTPLTIADKKSNDVIVNGLSLIFPEIPILSEESKKTPFQIRKEWEHFWIVDPLDGTKEFIKKNGEFSINLALIKNGIPIFGILYLPVKDILYYAAKSYGAYKRDNNGRLTRLLNNKKGKEYKQIADSPKRIIISRSHYTEETQHFVEEIEKQFSKVQLISVGSAMKIAYLAEEKADIYPRLAPTMEWDIAAGQIILEESGGEILDFYEKIPLIYNKENLRNPWFVAYKNSNQSQVSSIQSNLH
jgi:3'(2'), 5'-bisphosphate nucleotidase